MQQSIQTPVLPSKPSDEVLVISGQVFRALHPMDKLMARALERVGKVRIEENENLKNR
jgi:hypothetical protein